MIRTLYDLRSIENTLNTREISSLYRTNKPEPRHYRRNILTRVVLSAMLAIVPLIYSGCMGKARLAQEHTTKTSVGGTSTPPGSNESIDNYLRKEYATLDLTQADDYEFKIAVKSHGHFIKKYMPYVNVENPTPRDKAFISKLSDLDIFISYMTIDPSNFTESQKGDIEYFNLRKESGGLDSNDLRFISKFPWIDQKNLTAKDKAWLIWIAMASWISPNQ